VLQRRGNEKCPGRYTGRGIFVPSVSFDRSVSADVDEAQTAPGLNVLVAISADVEGRAAVEKPVTMTVAMVPAVTMTMVTAVTVTAVTVTAVAVAMAASRGRGHGGSAECDRGGDNK
jgi:hypothetical protein